MREIIIFILLFCATVIHAQQVQDTLIMEKISLLKNDIKVHEQNATQLSKQLQEQRAIIKEQNKKISNLIDANKNLKLSFDSLGNIIQENSQKIVTNSNELGTKIQETDQNTKSQIAKIDNVVNNNRLYWALGIVATLLLGGLIYWLLGKRISSSKTDVETQIENTKAALEEESVKLDNKLVEVLSKQLEVIKSDQSTNKLSNDNDHSLVLKVADRLTAMETNHYRMDPKTKGLKQLVRAVKSIKENYLANGYEIVEMIGQEYKEGLNVTANFIPSEEIETGKRVITRIIKPQVNYNGKMIQAAQIEVSVGE